MKTILVPTDFSECANNALKFAAFVARKTEANLNLVHVLEVTSIGANGGIDSTTDDIPYMMGLLKATKKRMNKLLKEPFLKGLKVQHNIETGSIQEHILKAAEKYGADMIIMGTHGAQGLSEILVGSTAEKIVKHSNIPVLTIKGDITEPEVKKIIYATDFSDDSYDSYFQIEGIAKLLDAELEVVKIITKAEFETTTSTDKAIHRFATRIGRPDLMPKVYYDVDKESGIRRFAHKAHADMIAVCYHSKQGLGAFFGEDLAEELVNHSALPVLTLNTEQKITGLDDSVALTELGSKL